MTRCPAGQAEVEMAELYVKPGERGRLARALGPRPGLGWGRLRRGVWTLCLPQPQYELSVEFRARFTHPSPPQATRSAAGTTRRSSHTGCRPRPADTGARCSPRESPHPRMDPPESPHQRLLLGLPQWGLHLLQVRLPGPHLWGVVLPLVWSPQVSQSSLRL